MKHPLTVIWALLVIVSCGGAAPRRDMQSGPAIPLVTFVFDDGNDTDFVVARELFAEQGVVACAAITTDWINKPGYLSTAQIIGLRDAGWEIMSHTVTHPHLQRLEPAKLEDELSRSKATLEVLGITVRNVVYPYNQNNDLVRLIASKYYRSGRGGTNSFNTTVVDPYYLKSFSNKHDLVRMKEHIDRAYAERSWLIFYHHQIDARVAVSEKQGTFTNGEQVTFSPSGAVGRYVPSRWALFTRTLYFVPLAGVPQEGDVITGISSNATARIDELIYNERAQLSEMVRYILRQYPDMKIVTIDQGLDLYGVPRWK